MFAQGKLLWHIVADYSVQAMKSEAALQNTLAITINCRRRKAHNTYPQNW